MTTPTAVHPLSGSFDADPVHSSITFAVRHGGVSTFRAGFGDVAAGLIVDGDGAALEGSAAAESITIMDPPEFRAHVLGPEFLDAERQPRIGFRSTDVELAEDGSASVSGDLTVRGVTRPVTASGTWGPAGEVPAGGRAALELETTVDRRDFGIDWQMQTPNGDDALGYEVTVTVVLELVPREV